MNEEQRKHYHALREECRSAKTSKELVDALNNHWLHIGTEKDEAIEIVNLSPVIHKKRSKRLARYMSNVDGFAFATKDGNLIALSKIKFFPSWCLSSNKPGKEFWVKLKSYLSLQKTAEKLSSKGRSIDPTDLSSVEEHLREVYFLAIRLLGIHPEGGVRAYADMTIALQRCLKSIPGISFERKEGSYNIIVTNNAVDNVRWRLLAAPETKIIDRYPRACISRIK